MAKPKVHQVIVPTKKFANITIMSDDGLFQEMVLAFPGDKVRIFLEDKTIEQD